MFLAHGFWITWCNLPDQGRDEYLAWLHGTYIPRLLARPGVLAAAHYASEPESHGARKGRVTQTTDPTVPAGDRYILIVGGANPHVFVDPVPAVYHGALSERDKKMLALRSGERSNIMIVEAEVFGPNGKEAGKMAFSPAIQLGSFNAGAYQDEDELAAWYARVRLPLSVAPGCVRVRKLVSVSGWAKHACLYEFASLEARAAIVSRRESADPELEAWSDRVVRKLVHAPGSPNVARRIWPPVERAA